MSNAPILVVGSANMDLVFRCPRFPAPGETLLGADFAMHPGGKGANQAVAAGRLGAPVSFVGRVGVDEFGVALRQSLESANVNCRFLATDPMTPTATAAILVDPAGQNKIAVASGANMMVSSSEVERAVADFDGFILSQLEIPLPAIEACASSRRFILNPAPATAVGDHLLAHVYAITPNETETEMLTGIAPVDMSACRAAANWFLSRGVRHVVITLGKRGAYATDGRDDRLIAAPKVEARDATAAGDALSGALTVFLAEGSDLFSACTRAVAYASLSTTREGAQGSMPTRAEFAEFWDTRPAPV